MAGGAAAQDGPALTAEAFEAVTLGKTWQTSVAGNVMVLQKFLPGRRAIWRDAAGCHWARWEVVADQICLTYADAPLVPECWVFRQKGEEIDAWYQGDMAFPPFRMRHGLARMACEAEGI